jgi:hypothetical protein
MAVNDRANVIFWTIVSWPSKAGAAIGANEYAALAGEMVQAIFRRRHQPRRPPLAGIRPPLVPFRSGQQIVAVQFDQVESIRKMRSLAR